MEAESEATRFPVDLQAALGAAFPAISNDALRPLELFEDEQYYLPTASEVNRVFQARSLRDRHYAPRIFDCEDFAYSLRADFALCRYREPDHEHLLPFAVGILWGGFPNFRHVLNVVVTADAGVQLIDSTPGNTPSLGPADWGNKPVDYIVI